MKFSKSLIFLFTLCSILSITFASEIKLSPAAGDMGDWCMIAVDIIADTQGKTIAAADVIMESSMKFVDFVPGDSFPYFLPPKVESTVVHIVWFAVEASQRISWIHKIWTAYFQKRSIWDRDWAVHLYFTKTWDTIDSNLSIAGWIDTLQKVSWVEYTFDWTSECTHEVASITDWIQDVPLDVTLKKIALDASASSSHTYIYRLSGLLLLIILWLIYFAKTRKWKKVA